MTSLLAFLFLSLSCLHVSLFYSLVPSFCFLLQLSLKMQCPYNLPHIHKSVISISVCFSIVFILVFPACSSNFFFYGYHWTGKGLRRLLSILYSLGFGQWWNRFTTTDKFARTYTCSVEGDIMAGHLVISMLPIHSRRPWASCNLYASYAFKTPMGFLKFSSPSLLTPFYLTMSMFTSLIKP